MLRWRKPPWARPLDYCWVILGLGFGAHVVDAMLRQGFSALAPFYQPDLGLSRTEVGLLSAAMSLGGVVLLLPAGRLCDRVSLRRALAGGLAVIALALVAVPLAGSFLPLFALLFITGLGHAWISPSTSRAVALWFPPRRRGTAMSVKQTGNPLGGILTAALLPPIALVAGWRAAVVTIGLATALVAVLVLASARERELPATGRSAKAAAGLRELLRQPTLWAASAVAAAFSAAQFITTTYLALYTKEVHAQDAVSAATFLAWALAGGFVGRIFWGVVSDCLWGGARGPVLALIGLIATLAALALGLATAPWPPLLLVAIALVLGASAIGWNGVYLTVLAETADPRTVGTVTAVGLMVANLGLAGGPPLFGWIVDLTGSYRWGWWLVALSSAVAAGIAWAGMRRTARRW
ncbi:MAG: MFS transporter [Chloroflexi bacterium]|nr:MFS transporter [Chloroflexota bacterium]